MARLSILALCAALLLSACGSGTPGAASGEGAAPAQLRREGRYMVDDKNRVVLLHGVNAVWKLAPYFPPATPEGFTAADADWLRDHGFNSVRLGVIFAGVMPERGRIDTDYLRSVDRVVQLLASRGIYVMFDFHQDLYSERFGGEGFPDWAVYDDGVPLGASLGFPANYFLPATSRAFDNLWADHENLWDYYRDAWAAVAAKWQQQGHHGGYDLLNEPYPGTVWTTCSTPAGCPAFDSQQLQPFYEHVLAGIRAKDAANLVFLEPNFLFNGVARTWLGGITPLTDANLGLSWHNYCFLGVVLHAQGFTDLPTCEEQRGIVEGNVEAAIAQMGATDLITEFGASDDLPDIEQVVRLSDQRFNGWQYWHYKEWGDPTTESQESGGQGLFTADGDLSTVKLDKLLLLERPYPQATAGLPLELSFDPLSKAFLYRYTPRAAQGPTEIYVPALHYPGGYQLELSGARLLSPAGSSMLRLEALPGAGEVRVALAPAP